jgi:hypothetical protein
MARDLAILLQPLAVAPEPGLESVDPRLMAVTGLASQNKYAAAADQAEELFSEGIYDIRLMSIDLFAAFREDGPSRIAEILAVLDHLLGDSYEAVGPVVKREGHFDKRVCWLFDEILDVLEYHEVKRTPEWEAWAAAFTPEALAAGLEAVERVADKLFSRRFESAIKSCSRIKSWLFTHREAPAAVAVAGATAPVSASAREAAAAVASVRPAEGGGRAHVDLAVSPRFLELFAKLRAFEALVEKSEFRKAALVADDVQQIVEHFDPRSYFPEVFAGFSARLSKNIGALAEHWEERDSVAWKALGQHYQVDLDGFVEG